MGDSSVDIKKMRVKKMKRQQGWTLWSMLFVMTVVFVSAYIVMQLVPIFSANENVKNAMRQSVEEKDLRKVTRAEIIRGMQDQLYLDGAHKLLDYKNNFKVSRTRDTLVIDVNYEREVPLVGNLYLVARFNPKLECDLDRSCEP